MKQSQLFTRTRKESPKDEVSKNADLLIRAGFIHKEMAGVYSLLPLGLRTVKKIEQIVRDEMNKVGGQEVSLTALQDPAVWQRTNRWDDKIVDNWFKTKLKNDTELGLAFTHEEALTNLMRDHIASYNHLPQYVYQFQTKFRNETRAKSGILRGREFLMKDLYSFSKNEEEHNVFYERAAEAYKNIFDKVGIGHITYKTFASGGSFSEFSHEYQTITDAGEDIIYVDERSGIAVNKEVFTDDVLSKLNLKKEDLVEKKSVEVGNIFTLANKFSEPLELIFNDESGNRLPVFMGSYGIGIGRLMGTIAEVISDEKGLVWPKNVAPFDIHLICLNTDNAEVVAEANKIYEGLTKNGFSVLFDDRDKQAGEKFADSDLIGLPTRIVVSKKTVLVGAHEVVDRSSQEVSEFSTSAIVSGTFLK